MDLFYYVYDVEGIEWICFVISYLCYFIEWLIDVCVDLFKFCEYFYILFQSGDNDVLQVMVWGYIVECYWWIIDCICECMFDVFFSVDVIVVFFGEIDVQYCCIFYLIEEIGFDQVNIVVYLLWFNIFVVNWENQLLEEVKVECLCEINVLVECCVCKVNICYEGCMEEVFVEGINFKVLLQLMG